MDVSVVSWMCQWYHGCVSGFMDMSVVLWMCQRFHGYVSGDVNPALEERAG